MPAPTPGSPVKRASVKDVAQAAGVSVATVSRSFNLPQTVRPELRERVFATAEHLGYSPNPSAKALRLQRTRIVGAVFPSMNHGIYAQMLNGFQTELSREGYLTVLVTVGFDNTNIHDPVRRLVEHGAEALMIVGQIEDRRLVAYLERTRIPVVCTYSKLPDNPFLTVGVDNYDAVQRMVAYLHGLGHREFAMICGRTQTNDRQRARRQAFIDAMASLRIDSPLRIFEAPDHTSTDFAAGVTRALHTEHPEVTALVCTSDMYGIAAIHTAQKMGLDVPRDLSITGFDSQGVSALTSPELTTIAVPGLQMGQQAAHSILLAMNGDTPVRHIDLEIPLVIRESCGPPPYNRSFSETRPT
ncbi:LacI family DNA-binding transcriptional regulator [Castellaniella sp. S9]|uniref:LacI family DNA-binding transcriptional regulator n=1 Tax=Castellaniella sp. S9 TaxID=2993652 RepID=UPI0022B49636|nr:LacI family DNA-binding transcriptional regulator [Castellaniella sp. S9]